MRKMGWKKALLGLCIAFTVFFFSGIEAGGRESKV